MGRGREGDMSSPSSTAARFAETERVIGRCGGLIISTEPSSLKLSGSSSSVGLSSVMGNA